MLFNLVSCFTFPLSASLTCLLLLWLPHVFHLCHYLPSPEYLVSPVLSFHVSLTPLLFAYLPYLCVSLILNPVWIFDSVFACCFGYLCLFLLPPCESNSAFKSFVLVQCNTFWEPQCVWIALIGENWCQYIIFGAKLDILEWYLRWKKTHSLGWKIHHNCPFGRPEETVHAFSLVGFVHQKVSASQWKVIIESCYLLVWKVNGRNAVLVPSSLFNRGLINILNGRKWLLFQPVMHWMGS